MNQRNSCQVKLLNLHMQLRDLCDLHQGRLARGGLCQLTREAVILRPPHLLVSAAEARLFAPVRAKYSARRVVDP